MKFELHHDFVFGLVPMFDMDNENSIPTLFASVLMVLIFVLLLAIALTVRTHSRRQFCEWLCLALIFAFLAVDEFVSIHENLTPLVRKSLNLSGLFYFAWVIPYTIISFILVIFFLPLFFRMPVKIRFIMLTSVALYFSGAVGMELIGGYYFELNSQVKDVSFALMASLEESLELCGSAFFIYSLLSYLSLENCHFTLEFSDHKF